MASPATRWITAAWGAFGALAGAIPLEAGAIGGRIVALDGGAAIEGAEIYVFNDFSEVVGVAISDADGDYLTTEPPIPGGSYLVVVLAPGFVDEVHPDTPCEQLSCGPAGGTPVAVTSGQTTSGVDFALSGPLASSISGNVTEEGSANPIEGAEVRAWYEPFAEFVATTSTAADGSYTLGELPGDGETLVVAGSAPGRIDERYPNVVCPKFRCVSPAASGITVVRDVPVVDIDFALEAGGTFAGTALGAGNGTPIEGGIVALVEGAAQFGYPIAVTDAGGSWDSVSAFPIGPTYRLFFFAEEGWRAELFEELPFPPGRPLSNGTPRTFVAPGPIPIAFTPAPRPLFAGDFETAGAGTWNAAAGIAVCGVDLCNDASPAPADPGCDPCVEAIVTEIPACGSSWGTACVAAFWSECQTLTCWN